MLLHRGLRALGQPAAESSHAQAGYPAADAPEAELSEGERRHAAGLMRVNHAGEVSAQALYQGQALVARDPRIREHLRKAAAEERAHLEWCRERLHELGEAPSRLSPLWYAGSFAIGAAAGIAGDRWNLGFVEETERQVVEHLDDHLGSLPPDDARSRAVVEAMKRDEARHGDEAAAAGARPLPRPVKALMRRVAQVMKFGAYRF
ncbi:MAG: 2-polyprenyl-3-methyl-6-methoxy-1,4-benzoquinone monooxygenase [Nevskia sp.]|nr:2-polyprenyl-3-methyl-6-methoxy-1,4-benzoquinone monooxygenase [Nevskia sp.]